jgi:hypothetical protein
MLDELKRRNEHASTRVDYVIVWSLSRWARNQRDHWQTRELVREAGAKLISITEPMIGDDSAAAFLYESMIATQNQFQSMQTSESVKRGLRQKASVGGTHGPAPLGYLNCVDELPDGRRVAIVSIDPDRGPPHHFCLPALRQWRILHRAACRRAGARRPAFPPDRQACSQEARHDRRPAPAP